MSQKERKLATLENSMKVRVDNYDVTMKHTEKSSIVPPECCFNCGVMNNLNRHKKHAKPRLIRTKEESPPTRW